MLRVDWAILCRYVEVNNGLATIVGAGIDQYGVQSLPATLDMALAVRLVGLPDEVDHTIEISVLDPLMQPVGTPIPEQTFTLNPPLPDFPAGWEMNVPLVLQLHIEVGDPGPYTIDIKVDGHSHTHTFRVLDPA